MNYKALFNHYILLVLFIAISFHAQAQRSIDSELSQLQFLLEELSFDDETSDIQQLSDELQRMLVQKIPINSVDVSELEKLFFLSPFQLNSLKAYCTKWGAIYSSSELALIDGFDENTAKLTALFLNFDKTAQVSNKGRYQHELLWRTSSIIEQQAGYSENKFAGNSQRHYLKYRAQMGGSEIGFSGEKDPGESFGWENQQVGFDHLGGFYSQKFKQNRLHIIVGDYVVQWGQGLAIWQGFSARKSNDALQTAQLNEGIKPYNSTDENNFMRGFSTKFKANNLWNFVAFASLKKQDATADSTENGTFISALQTSGLHRTSSELTNRKSVRVLNTGLKANFRYNNLKLGLAYIYTHLSLPIKPNNQPYNQFLFRGNEQQIITTNYQYNFHRLFFFGETSFNTESLATLNGFQFQPNGMVAFSVQQRNISKNYNAIYASSSIESSRVNDENGFRFALKSSPLSHLVVDFSLDFFQFNWIKYNTSAPSKGKEMSLQANYQLNKNWSINSRFFQEEKEKKIDAGKVIANTSQMRQTNRMVIDGWVFSRVHLRTRIDYTKVSFKEDSKGYFLSQDFGFTNRKENFKSWIRFAYFHTDDYESRIYAYENDLRYQFYIPSFYGEGFRYYLTVNYKFNQRWQLQVKYGETLYLNQENIGSGISEIEGNRRSEWKAQLLWSI